MRGSGSRAQSRAMATSSSAETKRRRRGALLNVAPPWVSVCLMLCWVHGEEGKGRGGIDGCEFRLVTRLLNRVGDFQCSICNQLEIPSCSTLVGSGNGLEDTCTQGPTLASRVNNHRHVIWPAPASEDTPQARTGGLLLHVPSLQASKLALKIFDIAISHESFFSRRATPVSPHRRLESPYTPLTTLRHFPPNQARARLKYLPSSRFSAPSPACLRNLAITINHAQALPSSVFESPSFVAVRRPRTIDPIPPPVAVRSHVGRSLPGLALGECP